LYFNFQGKWLEALPSDYIKDLSVGSISSCLLLIQPTSNNFAIFGLPLFYGYYVSHYMEAGRMEFTVHDHSDKIDISSNPISTETPKDTLKLQEPLENLSWLVPWLSVAYFVLALILWLFLLMPWFEATKFTSDAIPLIITLVYIGVAVVSFTQLLLPYFQSQFPAW
jgi:hypothetical protein